MEMIIFMGAQATGKSSFYKSRFFRTHIRVNLDMLKTRKRERLLLEACLDARQPLVVDNTNPSTSDRQRYIRPALMANFSIVGFYFQSIAKECIERNRLRENSQRVPDVAIRATINCLVRPCFEEGFGELSFVSLSSSGFRVEEWNDAI